MVVGEGEFECIDCDYVYVPANGDPDYPLPKGMEFKDLPEDWRCPVRTATLSSDGLGVDAGAGPRPAADGLPALPYSIMASSVRPSFVTCLNRFAAQRRRDSDSRVRLSQASVRIKATASARTP